MFLLAVILGVVCRPTLNCLKKLVYFIYLFYFYFFAFIVELVLQTRCNETGTFLVTRREGCLYNNKLYYQIKVKLNLQHKYINTKDVTFTQNN